MITIKLRTLRSRLKLPPDVDDVYFDEGEATSDVDRPRRAALLADKPFFTYGHFSLAWLLWTDTGDFTNYRWIPERSRFEPWARNNDHTPTPNQQVPVAVSA